MTPPLAGATLQAVLQTSLLDRIDTRILLGHLLGLSRIELITQSERRLSGEEANRLAALFARRLQGEPIAYLVARREFYGLSFHVTPAVLIPRPETELLVDLALARATPGARLLDLGTGCGAIAVALAHSRPDLVVTAIDASLAALAVASQNALQHLPIAACPISFLHSDWYRALPPAARFALIVANPPYIAQHDIHLSQGDLRFEPVSALTDHADGLSALRRIIHGASPHLEPGGWLLLEHGYDQAGAVRTLLGAQGFGQVQSWCDLAGIERVSGGYLGEK